MRFDWDEAKSELNEAKHGVPLEFGCEIWDGRVVTLLSRRNGEMRKLSIGRVRGEYWSVVWEDRGETRRLISVRLSTAKERSCYDRNDR